MQCFHVVIILGQSKVSSSKISISFALTTTQRGIWSHKHDSCRWVIVAGCALIELPLLYNSRQIRKHKQAYNCIPQPFISADIHLYLLFLLTPSIHLSVPYSHLSLSLPLCLFLSPPSLSPLLTQDRLGSRDGGTEVEGEAIYPRRIRRCVTEVWTVAAGQWRWQAPGRPAHMARGLWDYRQMAPGGWQTINKPTRIAGSAVYPQAQEIARERVHLCSEHFHSLLFLFPSLVLYNSCNLPMCLFHKNTLVVVSL